METALPAYQALTSYVDTEVQMFSRIPACAVIAIKKRFLKDESYEGFYEADMMTVLDKSK